LRQGRAHAPLEAAIVEQHGGGDQRTGKRAPSRLVGAGDERRSERAVVAQQAVARPEQLARWALTDGDGHPASVARQPPARGTRVQLVTQRADAPQKKRMRSGGQASPKALPSSWLRGTGPQMRESCESLRLSPMTK
jgi:hypothetical protein